MNIRGTSQLAGVFGWPVRHSRSPVMHNYWLEQLGIDAAYVPLAVAPEDFAETLKCLGKLGFVGANVTIPHKRAALVSVDHADDTARRVGAVNTITVGESGELYGGNTDGVGFMSSLTLAGTTWRPTAAPAALIGAGGAARAVLVALLDAGVPELRLINRSLERAEAVAKDLGDSRVKTIEWGQREGALSEAGLLVNTTAAGLKGNEPLDLNLSALPIEALVTDLIYDPVLTPLLENAQARGNPIVDGLGMLIHQAIPGFTAWFGVEPTVTPTLRELLQRDVVSGTGR
tara:strand:+ start:510 stop:1373 length:864 start_codon:yes stop_codon:yes gene_type:complete